MLLQLLALTLLMAKVTAQSASSQAVAKAEGATSEGATSEGIDHFVQLVEPELHESSGLGFSNRRRSRVWTHNDSGGKSRLFAFDVASGRKTGECRLAGIEAVDWEDMACFRDRGRPNLLIADCGDNDARRKAISLHLLREPDPDESTTVEPRITLDVSFPDGPRNCEAVAVDSNRDQIILVEKSTLPLAGVYATPLPNEDETSTNPADIPLLRQVEARRVATIHVPLVSAMDIDPATGDVYIVNYFHLFRFRCSDLDASIAEQFSVLPEMDDLPPWRQIEAIAIQETDQAWITSEGRPTPLGRLVR